MTQASDTRYVALLRGVNVGGVKVLMTPLKQLAMGLGWRDVRSYIASGNLVFTANGPPGDLAAALQDGMSAELGVETPVLVLTAQDLADVLAVHPWRPEKGNQSHVYFCWRAPRIDDDLYQSLRAPDEELQLLNGHVHIHAPSGIGRSKLAESLDKVIQGTTITGRNLNTVRKLVEMTR